MDPNQRRLIAVDVDGTLLNTEFDDVLRPREVAALEAVRNSEHILALCTGRNTRSINSLMEKSGWQPKDLPVVLLNGALVWGGTPHRCLACNLLDGNTIRRLVQVFRDFDVVPMIYGADEDGGVLHHERRQLNDVLGHYLSMRSDTVGAILTVDDLLELPWTQALEVGSIDAKDKILPLTEAINRELDGRVRVINTQSLLGGGRYYWAEVFIAGSDKGSGLRTLAGALDVPMDRVVAIGDNYNDLDMFAAAGVSVAMDNSPADVKKQAVHVTGHVNDHGAADVLEQIAAGRFPSRR